VEQAHALGSAPIANREPPESTLRRRVRCRSFSELTQGRVTAATSGSTSETLLALPPLRAIARLAAPTTFVMLMAAMSNVLYTYYVSRLGSEAIAAVSLVFPIALLAITAMGGGIGAGASSAVARALGAGDVEQAAWVAEHAVLLAAALGIAFAVLILCGAHALFSLMGGKGAVLERATEFAKILFGGAIIQFTGAMFDSILRAEGNVRIASLWSMVSIALQIVLTPFFMFVVGWGLPGAAVAMLVSQFLATIPRAYWVLGGKGTVKPRLELSRLSWTPLRDILRVGIPASLSTVLTYVGTMVLTGVVARFGDAHLAAYGLGTRLDFLLLSFVFGVGASVLTLVGMATGAGQSGRAVVYLNTSILVVLGMLSVPSLVLAWRPELWLHIFSHDPDIERVGALYFRIIGPSYPFLGVAMVTSFAFQGLGRATAPMLWMVVRVFGVVGAVVVCTTWLGMDEHAVFAVVAIGNVASAAVMSVLFRRLQRP